MYCANYYDDLDAMDHVTSLPCPRCEKPQTVPPSAFDPQAPHWCAGCGYRWVPNASGDQQMCRHDSSGVDKNYLLKFMRVAV